MILQEYTQEQTDALIADVERLASNIKLIGSAAADIVDDLYNRYVEAFKPGLIFNRKHMPYEKFVENMNPYSHLGRGGSTGIYIPSSPTIFQSMIEDNRYFRVGNFLGIVSLHVPAKYGVVMDEKYEILTSSTSLWSRFVTSPPDGFHTKISVLYKYAKKPLQIEEGDIWFIEFIQKWVKTTDDVVGKFNL